MSLTVEIRLDGRSPPTVASARPAGEYPAVSGPVRWEALVSGGTPTVVQYRVDDRLEHEERVSPYVFNGALGRRLAGPADRLDTRRLADGVHKLSCRAYAADGTSSYRIVRVSVANPVAVVAPPAVLDRELSVYASVRR